MRLGILLVLAVFCVSPACAEDLANPVTGEAKTAFLTIWGERLRSMRSLHMVFTQEKHLRLLRQALVTQGELWLKGETLLYVLTNIAGEKELMVRLDKQIPVQGGLGGGSANAAAALVGLARAWRVPVRPAQLTDVAGSLGADVPFFLAGGTALGLGRGDEIYPLADLPRHWIVILLPGFGVSSREAYERYDQERDLARGPGMREPQQVPGPWPSRAAQMINDLEAPIARHHPEIDQMKAALRRAGALAAAMSGSGSAVFGLFQKRRDALSAVDHLSGSGWRVLLTESLGRGDYERRSRPLPFRALPG